MIKLIESTANFLCFVYKKYNCINKIFYYIDHIFCENNFTHNDMILVLSN
jgi:hypothetical protein